MDRSPVKGTLATSELKIVSGVILLLLLTAAISGYLQSPLIGYDDLPFFYDRFDPYFMKTLTEGRWLNYLWSKASANLSPSWAFGLYLVAFGGFAAQFASLTVTRSIPLSIFVVLLIFVSQPVTIMMGWPSTLMLGYILVAIYPIIHRYTISKTLASALAFGLMTVLAFMSHPALAIVLLIYNLAALPSFDFRAVALKLAIFFDAVAVAILLIYSLNYYYHDYFGVVILKWRTTEFTEGSGPVTGIPSYIAHLIFDVVPYMKLQFIACCAAILLLAINDRWSDLKIFGCAAAALFTLDMAIGIKTGVIIPKRAYVWLPFLLTLPVLKIPNGKLSDIAAVLGSAASIAYLYIYWAQLAPIDQRETQGAQKILGEMQKKDAKMVVFLRRNLSQLNTMRIANKMILRWGAPVMVCDLFAEGADSRCNQFRSRIANAETFVYDLDVSKYQPLRVLVVDSGNQ